MINAREWWILVAVYSVPEAYCKTELNDDRCSLWSILTTVCTKANAHYHAWCGQYSLQYIYNVISANNAHWSVYRNWRPAWQCVMWSVLIETHTIWSLLSAVFMWSILTELFMSLILIAVFMWPALIAMFIWRVLICSVYVTSAHCSVYGTSTHLQCLCDQYSVQYLCYQPVLICSVYVINNHCSVYMISTPCNVYMVSQYSFAVFMCSIIIAVFIWSVPIAVFMWSVSTQYSVYVISQYSSHCLYDWSVLIVVCSVFETNLFVAFSNLLKSPHSQYAVWSALYFMVYSCGVNSV